LGVRGPECAIRRDQKQGEPVRTELKDCRFTKGLYYMMIRGHLEERLLMRSNTPLEGEDGGEGAEEMFSPIEIPDEAISQRVQAQLYRDRVKQNTGRFWATSSSASSGEVSEADLKLISRNKRVWRIGFVTLILLFVGACLLSLSSTVREPFPKRLSGFLGYSCLIGFISEIGLRIVDWLMHKTLHILGEEDMQKGLSFVLLLFHRTWINVVFLIWTILMVVFDLAFARFVPKLWVKGHSEILFKTCAAVFLANMLRILTLLMLERMTQDFNSRTYVKRIHDTMIDQWIVCNILDGVSRIKLTQYFQFLLKEMLENNVTRQGILNQLKAYVRERKVDGKEADLAILRNRRKLINANDVVIRRANQAFDTLMKKHHLNGSEDDDSSFDEAEVVDLDFETFREATEDRFTISPWSPRKVWREKFNPSIEDTICREDFCRMFARFYVKRRQLWESMEDSDSLLYRLDQFAFYLVFLFSLMITLAIFEVDFYKMWTALTSFLISMAVFLGPSGVTAAQNLIFLLAVHPFDVGDQIEIGLQQVRYEVLRINLLSTVMQRWDGAVCRMDNSKLASLDLHNLSTSGKRGLVRRFDVDLNSVTPDFFDKLKSGVKDEVLKNSEVYSGEWMCIAKDIHESLKCTVSIYVEFTYPFVDLTRAGNDEHNFNTFLIKQLAELGATYTYPIATIS